MKSALDCVPPHLSRSIPAAFETEPANGRIAPLRDAPGAESDDPTVRGLTGALLAALERPEQASKLFVDQVGLALATHMAATYGEAAPKPAIHSGGLAPWQLKRAKALMDAELSSELPVAVIAGACGLSASYFTRAFKLSTGMPPYRWLLQRRIDRAMTLLKTSVLSLSDIAASCGFADQSHFTRTFSRTVGVSPGLWRKASRS
jgi:AraC family transcriptional regulator